MPAGESRLQTPTGCTPGELLEFERLVREAFDGSDEALPDRIARAHSLALHRSPSGEPVAIAALKKPLEDYRRVVFDRARADADPDDYELELGWVYVIAAHRGNRLGETLCRRLLENVPGSGLFATTRPDNQSMIGILRRLGFGRAGEPYPHVRRNEDLVLLLRPPRRGRSDSTLP